MTNQIKYFYPFVGIITFLIIACSPSNKENKSIERINLLHAYENRGEVLLSSIADSVEYIILESNPNCQFEEPYMIGTQDSLIIIIAFQRILVFDRHTGAFKYNISSYGNGPDEFLQPIGNSFDENKKLIYTKKNNLVSGFSFDGKLGERFKVPQTSMELNFEFNITSFWPCSENKYIGYSKNYSGNNPYKLELFDSTGQIIKHFPNYNSFDKKKYNGGSLSIQQGWFFVVQDSIRFFEQYTDTIYTFSNDNLIPRYELSMGALALPYYLQGVEKEYKNERLKLFYISDMRESSRFLFFTVGINLYKHFCVYDKKLKQAKVCEEIVDKEYYKYPTYYEQRVIGFMNDIDDFLPIGTGRSGLFINRNDEMSTYILAQDVERWFKLNPDKSAKLPDKLKKFSKVQPLDNIIVEIVKLKK
jgi:hypothetical protein